MTYISLTIRGYLTLRGRITCMFGTVERSEHSLSILIPLCLLQTIIPLSGGVTEGEVTSDNSALIRCRGGAGYCQWVSNLNTDVWNAILNSGARREESGRWSERTGVEICTCEIPTNTGVGSCWPRLNISSFKMFILCTMCLLASVCR